MSALGYIFIFYIGFYFYRLAENHKRNKWLYGLIGVLFYFFGYFMYLMYVRFFVNKEFDEFDFSIISIKSLCAGFVSVYMLFHYLNYNWKRKQKR